MMSLVVALALLAAPPVVSGVVRDQSGAPIPGAAVIVLATTTPVQEAVTGSDGRFTVTLPDGATSIVVRLAGFQEWRRDISRGDSHTLDIVLEVGAIPIDTVVTATVLKGERAAALPAALTSLDQTRIEQAGGVVADDVLRQIPAFSLFRRSSSLVSHPTTQGVSLRGIGPSGVSRTLVQLDGVPLNDPFGGWVYWDRVPLVGADRMDVVESPSSSLYGNYAMGGVISIASRAPAPRLFEGSLQYGNHGTPRVEFDAGHIVSGVGLMVAGSALRTDGYPIVAPAERGAVDTNAASRFANLTATAEYPVNGFLQGSFRAGVFGERRLNGRRSTVNGDPEVNDTSSTSASGGIHWERGTSALRATVFGEDERFHSNFLAVPAATPARSIGRMSLDQTVPARSAGGGAQWFQPIGSSQLVTAGGDWRWVTGNSEENALDSVTGTTVTLMRVSGGRQQSAGAFVEDQVRLRMATITGSARIDRWQTYDGHNLETSVPSGAPTAANRPALPDRIDTVVSPRLGAVLSAARRLRLWTSVGSGFRAPTLNELYRQFRVGSVLTLPNSELGPERLLGYEAGATLTLSAHAIARATWYDDRVRDPVSNVTIATAGASVTQERENLGRTNVRGLELDAEYRAGASWTLRGAFLHDRSVVTDNPAQPAIVGNVLPQVPADRVSLGAVFSRPRAGTVSGSLLYTSAQFDDDLNSRRLPPYTIVNLTASHAVGRTVALFVSIENLFNRTYLVGTLPTTIGSPRFASVGVRVH